MAVLCGMPKRSASCAQAVYFVHSTSVTWLNSRWWLAACNWVMSALSAVLSTCVGRRRKFGEVSSMECTGQGNYLESIPTVKMETRNPVAGYFGRLVNFRRSVIIASCGGLKSQDVKNFRNIFAFFGKTTPYGKIFKIMFQKFLSRHRSTCYVHISWNLADGKSVKSCVAKASLQQY